MGEVDERMLRAGLHSARWSRRGFLGLAGAGVLGVAGGTGVAAGLLGEPPADPTRDPDVLPGDAAHAWVRAAYNVVWNGGSSTPTNAARIYCALAVAMYESVAPASQSLRTLSGQLTDLRPLPQAPPGTTDPPCVMAGAVRTVADHLFRDVPPFVTAPLSTVYDQQIRSRRATGVPAGVVSSSIEHGVRLGRDLVLWLSTDGYRGTERPYFPPVGPSRWRSSPPSFGEAVGAYFSEVRSMVLTAADEVAPVAPVPFSTNEGSPFWEQANATYQAGLALTQAQRLTAMFWRDNPHTSGLPSGHWMQITRQTCTQQALSLTQSVEAYARVGVALHDAFLNCWTWKYRYNLIRPVDYVHDHIDPNWQTWVATPPFPEYTSGHSVGSAAAATVLTDLFGDLAFTDVNTVTDWGTRQFDSFQQAAEEAAISRLYGGIHFPMAIEFGVDQGEEVGELVINRLVTRA